MITLEEYQQIQEYKANGVSIVETSKCLNITEWNVRSWWNRSEDDLEEYLNKQLYSFDNYRQYIIELIKKCPQISNTNVMSRLQEDFPDFDATYSTFNRYVKNLRVQAGLSQPKRIRCIRDDQPPGYEAQVDFGE
ncbi:MAG: hypothetical protein J6B37_07545 [Clostridia bacterium]|nr:hypothetical protein [Clostridia bacterium]